MERLRGFGIILLQKKMISVYLLLVVLFQIGVYTIEPGCENCGCCVDNVCSPKTVKEKNVTEYCTEGCIPGMGGYRCYNNCANDCATCYQEYHKNCVTCDNGKYINNCDRCADCPHRCKKCTSDTQCQECYAPYYNDDSTQDCSLSCPRNCFCGNIGVCSYCKDGFYNASNSCQNECHEACQTCTDQSHCQSCKPSYSGDICCTEKGHCLKCSSRTECKTCLGGYYGNQCRSTCSTRCEGSRCKKENGNCFSCLDGYYGAKCDKSCPKTCHNLQCERNTGICLSCNVGFYGDNCTEKCSEACYNNSCNKQTGLCADGYLCGFTESNNKKECIVIEDSVGDIRIGTVIGISAIILVVLVTMVVNVTIIIVRKWKMNFLRKNQSTPNVPNYVNTHLQTTSIDTVDVSIKNDQTDQSKYERLDRLNDKQRHEYEEVTPVNK